MNAEDHRTDEQLVADHIAGDESAFPLLVKRYIQPLFRFTLRLCNSAQDAEDIVQTTFVKSWRSIRQFNQNERFKPWLYRIAHNATMDQLRKRKDIVFSDVESDDGQNPLLDKLEDPEPLPDEILERADASQITSEALSKLKPSERSLLLLRYQQDLTFEELSKILKKPLNTVKSQHHRAIQKLRTILDAPKRDAGT